MRSSSPRSRASTPSSTSRYARDLVFGTARDLGELLHAARVVRDRGELLRFGDWLDLDQVERPAQLLSALPPSRALSCCSASSGGSSRRGRGFASGRSPASAPARRCSSRPRWCTRSRSFSFLRRLRSTSSSGSSTSVAGASLAAVGLGLALGAAQLVRSVGLWIYVAAAVTLPRRDLLSAADVGGVSLVAAVALALGIARAAAVVRLPPGRVRRSALRRAARDQPGAPARAVARERWRRAAAEPTALRAPLSFFTATGLPESIKRPYRGAREPAFVPVVLADTWGDYFGQWRWGIPDATRDPPDRGGSAAVARRPAADFVALSGLAALAALFVTSRRGGGCRISLSSAVPALRRSSSLRVAVPVGRRRHGQGALPASGRPLVRGSLRLRGRRRDEPACRVSRGSVAAALLVAALAACAEFGNRCERAQGVAGLSASALALAVLAVLWVAGWAIREDRDVDPTARVAVACLETSTASTSSSPPATRLPTRRPAARSGRRSTATSSSSRSGTVEDAARRSRPTRD